MAKYLFPANFQWIAACSKHLNASDEFSNYPPTDQINSIEFHLKRGFFVWPSCDFHWTIERIVFCRSFHKVDANTKNIVEYLILNEQK